MDNTRLLLWATFSLLLWFTYQAWVTQYPAPAEAPPPVAGAGEVPSLPPDAAQEELPQLADLAEPPAVAAPAAGEAQPARPLRIRTDVLEALIDGQGGDLVRVDLPGYPVEKGSETPMRLLDFTEADRWVFQTGVRSAAGSPTATSTRSPTGLTCSPSP